MRSIDFIVFDSSAFENFHPNRKRKSDRSLVSWSTEADRNREREKETDKCGSKGIKTPNISLFCITTVWPKICLAIFFSLLTSLRGYAMVSAALNVAKWKFSRAKSIVIQLTTINITIQFWRYARRTADHDSVSKRDGIVRSKPVYFQVFVRTKPNYYPAQIFFLTFYM